MSSLTSISNRFLEPVKNAGEKKALSVMDRIFNKLDGIYPHKWRSAFASEQAIENWREAWADAFFDERLTLAEIKAGLAACRHSFDWPPSLPEFIKLCRPALVPEAAWHEAVTQMRLRAEGADNWSHPAVYWSAVAIGEFDLRNLTFQAAKARWSTLLADNLKKELMPIPKRMAALPAPGRTQTSVEAGREKIRAICEGLGASKAFDLPKDMHKSIKAGVNE